MVCILFLSMFLSDLTKDQIAGTPCIVYVPTPINITLILEEEIFINSGPLTFWLIIFLRNWTTSTNDTIMIGETVATQDMTLRCILFENTWLSFLIDLSSLSSSQHFVIAIVRFFFQFLFSDCRLKKIGRESKFLAGIEENREMRYWKIPRFIRKRSVSVFIRDI